MIKNKNYSFGDGVLYLRPHHFLSLYQLSLDMFSSQSNKLSLYLKNLYGNDFYSYVSDLAEDIISDDALKITFVDSADLICGMCAFTDSCLRGDYGPLEKKDAHVKKELHLFNDGVFETYANPALLDMMTSHILGVKVDETYSVRDLFTKMFSSITDR